MQTKKTHGIGRSIEQNTTSSQGTLGVSGSPNITIDCTTTPQGLAIFDRGHLVVVWNCKCERGESSILRNLESKKFFNDIVDCHKKSTDLKKNTVFQELRRQKQILVHTDSLNLSLPGHRFDLTCASEEVSASIWDDVKGDRDVVLVGRDSFQVIVPASHLLKGLRFPLSVADGSGSLKIVYY